MNEKISCIIIDDELLARKELRFMLSNFPEIDIIDEAKNVTEAIKKIEEKTPDLIFLDIAMPGKNGFDLLEDINQTPIVVFVTAYDSYAVKAFEENALDYILKPTSIDRLQKTVEKIKLAAGVKKEDFNVLEKQLFIKDGSKCHFIKFKDITLIEAAGNYSKVYYSGTFCLANYSLKRIIEKLPQNYFFRINRQQIINLNHIAHIDSHYKGGLNVTLFNKMTLEVSQRNAVELKHKTKL